ncbi:MFS transporter [Cryobacterium sp. TMT1-62]|uniref:MFS transporter n=1 Tax=unclassified Cryobacterium TaxID=2649013 RepID=UPI00106AAB2B|nr:MULTISPECIES: MFS transporter [unclassified Cryobacterium]TFB57831.1 MFS transporter [Cryobacterium sp. Sr3]TFB61068.1 MFS transporter [Cryobacterium sp. Hz7]TFC38236.1 MFS transporter [Cryobacterium sp. TMT2-14]TFC50060.1 MFS transporter [Cryobacterium sp. TMT2-17-1]TFC69869.1 MFS transporter [Cryobacterium sp. TMT2-4]
MFRSLSIPNYRIWFAGALVSNIGTWMQRTAQDWIVLTELTDYNATAVGIVMALQFGPQLVLMPWSGLIADRFNRRRLLILTQTLMGLLALGLGVITVTGVAELWHVYLFALGLGIVAAIDAPARQTFVSELVSDNDLPNAVALNSASFNGARLIGPAAAGLLTVAVGAGWVFMINSATFAATVLAMTLLRTVQLRPQPRATRERGQLMAGFRYVSRRPDIIVVLITVFLVGTFGFNFAIFTATMATVEFGMGASEFGLLSSIMAIGSVAGALMAARRGRPRLRLVIVGSFAFGLSCAVAAVMPNYLTFAISLTFVGLSSLTLMTTANAYVQTTTRPAMRGRVMALYMAIFAGGTPLGAPLVGWVADQFGPRWALGVAALSGLLAAGAVLFWMVRYRSLRVRFRRGMTPRMRVHHDGDGRTAETATREIAIVEATATR